VQHNLRFVKYPDTLTPVTYSVATAVGQQCVDTVLPFGYSAGQYSEQIKTGRSEANDDHLPEMI